MPQGWEIELTPADEKEIRRIAAERQAIQSGRGIGSERVDPTRTDYQIHEDGARGEFAFRKHLDLGLPLVLPYGDGGKVDVVLGGRTVQIKTRAPSERVKAGRADFIVPLEKTIAAEVAVMMEIVAPLSIRAVGWLEGWCWWEWRQWAKLNEPGWLVPRWRLSDMDALLEFCDRRTLALTAWEF